MPRRYLAPSIARDQLLAEIANQEPRAALFYLMALPHAGDDCALPTRIPSELRLMVCPGLEGVTRNDVASWVELLTTQADEGGHTLMEYGEDGRLRYPPRSFYRYQTYVPEAKRPTAEPAENAASVTNAPEPALSVDFHAERREQQLSTPRARMHAPSFTVTPSPSVTPSPPTAPTEPTEVAPETADAAPDAPPVDGGTALVAVVPVPEGRASKGYAPVRRLTDEEREAHQSLWDAFTAVFGPAMGKTEEQRRGEACKRAREARASPDDIRLAAAHWANVMADATMTELGITSNLGKLLHGPQVNGRSNGVTVGMQQTIRQTATLPTSEDADRAAILALRAARKGR